MIACWQMPQRAAGKSLSTVRLQQSMQGCISVPADGRVCGRWLAVWTDAAEVAEKALMRLGPAADTGYSDTYYLWIYFGLGAVSIVLQVGLLSSGATSV